MGGDIDWNVPILGGEQMYQALKSLGRETELVVYPGEYHEFKSPSHLKDRLERYLAWYAHYVKADGTPARPVGRTKRSMEDGRPAQSQPCPCKDGRDARPPRLFLPAVSPVYPNSGLFMRLFDFLKAVKSPEHRLAWLVAIAVDAIQIVALPLICRRRACRRWMLRSMPWPPWFLSSYWDGIGLFCRRWRRNWFRASICFPPGRPRFSS